MSYEYYRSYFRFIGATALQ